MSDEPNKPIDTLRDGALKVSIFRNRRDKGDIYTFSPGRVYTDQDGGVRESKTLSGSEALRMARLLDKSYERTAAFRETMKAKARGRDRDDERER